MWISADTVEYHASSGEPVTCYWYTIDTTYARVTIYKYACPEDYIAAGQTYDAVLQACPAPIEGVRFDFDTSGQNYDVTDDEGIAGFRDITPGLQTITETPPPDYSGAIVFCREIDPSQPEPEFAQVPVENLTIEREVAGGNELECHWFNTKTTYARAAVHKFACPEGYVPQSNSYQGRSAKVLDPAGGRHLYTRRARGGAQRRHRRLRHRGLGRPRSRPAVHQRNAGGWLFRGGRLLRDSARWH